ncbi:hypothetical protein ACFOOM_23880 [Streptomyces echinoruber]|uniref:Uncharacterized protein n=1 Tax=Streptomyces echinoruber TaxID=68898 RepID=A0A918R5Y4_9ACTN|nr:hypothetical protein [Streptomyces echinoruber]GGZ84727.1 hypothetical protein GCM10010389_23810 [Streptomyces echinoruber]
MTVPEENRSKTGTTDAFLDDPEGREQREERESQGGTGRTLREALEEAQVRPEDFTEE